MAFYLPPPHQGPPARIIVLISGNGTNLQALIDATTTGDVLSSTTIIRVICNKKNAHGLTRAAKADIPIAYHNLISGKYLKPGEKDPDVIRKGREAYDADLADLVLKDRPDLVVCAGWMHILAPTFLQPLAAARVPVINLHPALPGKYDGTNAIQRAWEDFQKWSLEEQPRNVQELRDSSVDKHENARAIERARLENREHTCTGAMIHYVINEVDRGEPIIVEYVDFKLGETLEDLTERMHNIEHVLIVRGTGLAISKLREER